MTLYENIEAIENEVIRRARKLRVDNPKRYRMIIAAKKFKDYRLDLPVNEAMQHIDDFEYMAARATGLS